MIINYNSMASNALRQLNVNSNAQAKSMAKLSSGLRINSAADDAAGLSISEKMKGQINGLNQAARNAQDGQSLVNTAEGALGQTTDILQRMRELATQSSNDTNTSTDRQNIQQEVNQLATEITRISNTTQFNNQTLLNGGMTANGTGTDTLQIGANSGQTMSISINAMDAKSLGVAADSITGATGAGAGKVSGASFDNNNLGSAVVNNAVISLTYTAGTAGSAGTPATAGSVIGGAAAAPTTDLSTIGAGTAMTITIDGTAHTLNAGTLQGATGATGTNNTLLSAINNAIGTSGTAIMDNGSIRITSASSGTTSNVSIAVTGAAADVTAVQTAFGLNNGQTNTGTAAVASVAATDATVTLSDKSGHVQTVDISDPTQKSFSTTSGAFAGMSVNLTGAINTLGNKTGVDTLTVSTTGTSAAAAVFVGGQKISDAVASAGIDVSSSAQAATNAITTIDNAINTVSSERAKLGAYSNRLDNTINNLNTSSQNTSDAQSRIADVDMAGEMMNQSKASVLAQAAQAMLAQANQQPQQVLQLLRG